MSSSSMRRRRSALSMENLSVGVMRPVLSSEDLPNGVRMDRPVDRAILVLEMLTVALLTPVTKPKEEPDEESR